jgi:NADH-quinone oxidoreductase subunit L
MHETAAEAAQAMVAQVSYLWLIPAFPLVGVLFNLFLGRRAGKGAVSFVAPAVVGAAFAVSCAAFLQLLDLPAGSALQQTLYRWITAGNLSVDLTFRIDALSAVMVSIVSGVGFLIHVYSVGYMHDDERYARYFTYLNLFTLAMLTLVLADSLPVLFVGWEGVGLCSYLLIGFWFTEQTNAAAGKKAFVVNRVGDAGFLLATFLLFWNLPGETRSLSFQEIAAGVGSIDPTTLTWIATLLFVGATGKSAQLPLYVWLPDAMAGPTPVSALIHAATMVTAGVYMIARLSFLYLLAPTAMEGVALIGGLTAIFAATIGLVQNDIKKVLAYSTVSQLGYMFLAVGVGAFSAGIFHLMTHAFFKGLLFLGSGSVIHGMGGEQDMRKMGGLRHHMPVTFATFAVGTVAIAGIPPLAGFFSKDSILAAAMATGHAKLWLVGVIAAGLTSFYMFRLLFLTFFGESRADEHTRHHIHESPPSMLVPLGILAVLSLVGGWVGLPLHWLWGDVFGHFLAPVVGAHVPHLDGFTEGLLMAASIGVALIGFTVALFMYVLRPLLADRLAAAAAAAYQVLLNKYYVDEIYDALIVRPLLAVSNALWSLFDVGVIDAAVNGVARIVEANSRLWRRVQTGNVQHYAVSMLLGAMLLLGYYALRAQ